MFTLDGSCWLTPGEQEEAIVEMYNGNVIVYSPDRILPLKSGGFTDIYVNLRLMRSQPHLMHYLSELYANPLRRLRLNRFIEVPEAVSPMAGAISISTNLPVVTIREEAKPGRMVKGKTIGDLRPGERVAIIDDVVTDGASKIAALSTLRSMGVGVAAMVVMVDCQQGWKKKLTELGFGDIPVWAGMTLHDIRKYLVKNGLMERCSPTVEGKNPIIVALDGKNWEDILPLIDPLRTSGCILKVNDLLLARGLEWMLPNLSVYGRVMADLKCYDIPNTVANICKRLRVCPPWAVTVHASGAGEMIKAAKKELEGTSTKVLAVTVLTSFNRSTCEEVYVRRPLGQVLRLAEIAIRGGADGFVCSPKEVGRLSKKYPGKAFVTPGVRSPGVEANDQQRIDTPKNAMASGATHLVMGRQILGAKDSVAEVKRVVKEELGIEV